MYEREREFALSALRTAAVICRAVQAQIDPGRLDKADKSPVTVADLAVQAAVSRLLAEQFPADPLVAEETADELRTPAWAAIRGRVVERVAAALGQRADEGTVLGWIDRGQHSGGAAGRFWTLDPVDGTKGFLRRGQYAVALALIVDGRPQLGGLACPNLPERIDPAAETPPNGAGALFIATRGRGAEMHGLAGAGPVSPLRVSPADPDQARCCESVEAAHSSHDDAARVTQAVGLTRPGLRLDSQAKYAVVARGEAALYFRLSPNREYREKIWDHAAGALVVEEAGGRVTDVEGRPLDFSQGRLLTRNTGIVASNGGLHERVLAAIREVLPR